MMRAISEHAPTRNHTRLRVVCAICTPEELHGKDQHQDHRGCPAPKALTAEEGIGCGTGGRLLPGEHALGGAGAFI